MNASGVFKAASLFVLVGMFIACEERIGMQIMTQSVDAEGARSAEVDLRMGAGELRLSAADQDALLEGTFCYNRPRLKPELDYRLFNERGILRIGHERSSGVFFGNTRNEWTLRMSKAIPVALRIKLGAGQSDLDLRGLQVSSLDIDMGVGQMLLDLRGPRAGSLDVRIDGGVGSGTIDLPADVGVRIKVDGGLGSVNVRGLQKRGDVYTNEAYGRAGVEIDIDIDAGIGSLNLRVESGDRVRI